MLLCLLFRNPHKFRTVYGDLNRSKTKRSLRVKFVLVLRVEILPIVNVVGIAEKISHIIVNEKEFFSVCYLGECPEIIGCVSYSAVFAAVCYATLGFWRCLQTGMQLNQSKTS